MSDSSKRPVEAEREIRKEKAAKEIRTDRKHKPWRNEDAW